MKKPFASRARIILFCVLLLLFALAEAGNGPARAGQATLKVLGGQPVAYTCDNNALVTARYYRLSDDSLSFVKLDTPDGSYTLPQLVSGSGVRYTNEFELLWWIKGDTAFAQQPDNNGGWQTVYDNCKATKK